MNDPPAKALSRDTIELFNGREILGKTRR